MVSLPIGDASNGLCGGMAFAARDYFEAEKPPPDEDDRAGCGAVVRLPVERLFDSFDLPVRARPVPGADEPAALRRRVGLEPYRAGAARTCLADVRDEWPKIRADIDAGHPSALGLVKVKSSDPRQLKHDHQVLAYGYDLEGEILKLRVYDPNLPGRDDVTLSLCIADPWHLTVMTMLPSARPVYAFFRVAYEAATPP